MKKPVGSKEKRLSSAGKKTAKVVIGRARFTAISAVEGSVLSRDMKGMFARFDRQKTPPAKRRELLMKHFKGSSR